MPSIAIHHRFDGGNIEVVDASSVDDVQLRIRPDAKSKHMQWFCFRVTGARGKTLRWRILNAGEVSYPGGWKGYRPCASYDRENWFRIHARYQEGELSVEHEVEADAVWYAYFAPYSYERHQALVARCQAAAGVTLEVLGTTVDGRPMDMLRVGTPGPRKRPIWIVARQHPGETMAEWFMEGLLDRLLDGADGLAHMLRKKCVFYIVPNMNPDGSVRGHLRTNAVGANLNREWEKPTKRRSPEVLCVKEKMAETGVALCLDVHGDEALPYNFIAGPDGVADLAPHILPTRDAYSEALERACPDFQRVHGYPKAEPGKGNMTMCTNQVAHAFGAVSMTLEQPFKDNANRPDPDAGWSPARCALLGRAQLDALAAVLEALPEPAART